ncbi:MAG: PDZ domain-containing protein [Acidobacteria bacterium]|nr:PDZ domain-containing protein [Acidobacteriota bacterium]
MLVEAQRLYDLGDYDRAIAALDPVIARLDSLAAQDAEARSTLMQALELRVRARLAGRHDWVGARDDFKAILMREPRHVWPPTTTSPSIRNAFEDARKQIIGEVLISVAPDDAVVELDDRPVTLVQGQPVALTAGTHKLTATRLGYATRSQAFQVIAAAPGQVLDVSLQRESATLAVITSPAGVEVFIGGESKGTTPPGPAPVAYADDLAKQNLTLASSSGRLEVGGIAPGRIILEFKMDCYAPVRVEVQAEKPTDLKWIQPMKPAVATVRVESETAGIPVFLDEKPKGSTPTTLENVCEGSRTVEARTTSGRFVRRLELRAGDNITLKAALRPAFGMLSVTGLQEGIRGGPDLRRILESMTKDSGSIMFFAPTVELVQQNLQRLQLPQTWLALDRNLQPLDEAASKITQDARMDFSSQLSRNLGVQGIATIARVPDREPGRFYVNMLAAGSGKPDQLEVNLTEPGSMMEAVTQLTEVPTLFQPSVGMLTIDVLDHEGAIVVRVDPGGSAATAGISVGDVIVAIDGKPVQSGAAFAALLSTKQTGQTLKVDYRNRTGGTRSVDLAVTVTPRAISMEDRTLLMNKLLVDYRARLAGQSSPIEESVTRLNVAVALGALENWAECQRELERVTLKPGRGVSAGTVVYLQALCAEKLGNVSEAERLYKVASESPDSLLTEDGPGIKELAERRLAQLRPTIRR